MLDHYQTVTGITEHRIKVERSEFVGIALSVDSDAAFSSELRAYGKRYFDATHLCWAYRILDSGEPRSRSADAGEPSGTAGKPILSSIEGSRLLDTAVIVARYFGGVKLGTGGLSRAYRECARQVLEVSATEDRYLYQRVEVETNPKGRSAVYRLISPPDVVLVEERFDPNSVLVLNVRRSAVQQLTSVLTQRQLRFAVVAGIGGVGPIL